jgi:hypothetical protein
MSDNKSTAGSSTTIAAILAMVIVPAFVIHILALAHLL